MALGRGAAAAPVVAAVLDALADDLDAPAAVAAVQAWADATLGKEHHLADTSETNAGATVSALVNAALGIKL